MEKSQRLRDDILIEKAESHVIIFLLLGLLLLGLGGGGGTTGGSATSSGTGSSDTRADLGDQVLQVAALESLGEESGPVGLEVDSGSLEDGGDLLGGDGDVVIGEDEGGVHAGELGRHGGVRKFPRDLAQ